MSMLSLRNTFSLLSIFLLSMFATAGAVCSALLVLVGLMFRVTIKLCIALLLLTVIADAQDKLFDIPLDNPSRSFNAPPVSEVKISRAVVASIKNGDFVHPTFSPDGRILACAKVLLQGDFENTEVLLNDLSTRKHSVLLDSRRAETYATYKASVTGMAWRSPKRLEVLVSDGDVDLTRLIFDPYSRKLLRTRAEGLDETAVQPMPPIYQKAYEQAQSLFPSFPRDVLVHALRDTALVIPGQGIVLQKNYAGHDDNVWFLDFQNKSVKALISLSADSARSFNGGVSFKSSIIMLLSGDPKAYLFLYRDGKIKALAGLNSTGFSQIEVKHVSSSKVIFLIRSHAAYERGDNPLFMFDGERLLRIKEYAELYDADVDARGRQIAYCYWVGDKRHIVVKEMN
jgi:hypothetical protein